MGEIPDKTTMAYQPPRLMKPENYCTSCSKGYLMANFSGGRCGLCQRLHDIKPVRGSLEEKSIKVRLPGIIAAKGWADGGV